MVGERHFGIFSGMRVGESAAWGRRSGEAAHLVSHGLSKPSAMHHRYDIILLISEVVAVEQILIRNLPDGTKAALRARAAQSERSVEAEARSIIVDSVYANPPTMVDLLSVDDGTEFEFEPSRLGLTARVPEL